MIASKHIMISVCDRNECVCDDITSSPLFQLKLPTLTHPKKGISELCFFVLTNVGMVVTFVLLLLIAIYQEELDRLILDP